MKIRLETPHVPVQYEPVTITLETEDEFLAVHAAAKDYAAGRNGHVDFRRAASQIAKRMESYASGTTIIINHQRPYREPFVPLNG
jgi:hypothetical protein